MASARMVGIITLRPEHQCEGAHMSELSKGQYLTKIRELIDQSVFDPDILFQRAVLYYFQYDAEDDWFWDAQDDMEDLLDAFGGLCWRQTTRTNLQGVRLNPTTQNVSGRCGTGSRTRSTPRTTR